MSDFKAFAASGGANVETQAAFVADTTVLNNGFTNGIADPLKLNKVWRQSSIISAVLAQFIEDMSTVTSVDDGTTTSLLSRLKTLIGGRVAHTWLANDYVVLPGGIILQWGTSTNTGTTTSVTFPVAFSTALFHISYGTIAGNLATAANYYQPAHNAESLTGFNWGTLNSAGAVNTTSTSASIRWLAIGI
jgi:hypothetical protein